MIYLAYLIAGLLVCAVVLVLCADGVFGSMDVLFISKDKRNAFRNAETRVRLKGDSREYKSKRHVVEKNGESKVERKDKK